MKYKKTLIALVSSLLVGCSSQDDAIQAAKSAGWKNVYVTKQEFFFNFTCQEGEMAYRIQGLNPRNEPSKATVCCGYTTPFKGCTIRY